jgi:hypothetical protein
MHLHHIIVDQLDEKHYNFHQRSVSGSSSSFQLLKVNPGKATFCFDHQQMRNKSVI